MTPHTDRTLSWTDVRGRLKQIETSLAESFAPDQRLIDQVYRQRAQQLAERQTVGTAAAALPVLIFRLGTERYAIELSDLAEVLPYTGCTAVPGAPPALLGVLNVRGEIRSIADLRLILGLSPTDDGASGYVLMLRRQGEAIGFRVDAIDQVSEIDLAHLISTHDGTSAIPGARCIKAVTADLVVVIDTSAALSRLGPAIT